MDEQHISTDIFRHNNTSHVTQMSEIDGNMNIFTRLLKQVMMPLNVLMTNPSTPITREAKYECPAIWK